MVLVEDWLLVGRLLWEVGGLVRSFLLLSRFEEALFVCSRQKVVLYVQYKFVLFILSFPSNLLFPPHTKKQTFRNIERALGSSPFQGGRIQGRATRTEAGLTGYM